MVTTLDVRKILSTLVIRVLTIKGIMRSSIDDDYDSSLQYES